LPANIDAEARQQHDGDGVAAMPLVMRSGAPSSATSPTASM
jgi:hypothetical protein